MSNKESIWATAYEHSGITVSCGTKKAAIALRAQLYKYRAKLEHSFYEDFMISISEDGVLTIKPTFAGGEMRKLSGELLDHMSKPIETPRDLEALDLGEIDLSSLEVKR